MSTDSAPYDRSVILDRLTTERLRSYYAAASNDPMRTFALYEWNIDASSAVLGVAAIAVRNAIDRELVRFADRKLAGASWFEAVQLDHQGRDALAKARWRARRPGQPEVHGKVIAELMFGFWRYLVAWRYHASLWVPAVHKAFPYGPADLRVRRAEVEDRLQQLAFVRNRAAHHEPIHRRDLLIDHRAAVELVGWICPDSAAWIGARSGIPAVSAARPIRLP